MASVKLYTNKATGRKRHYVVICLEDEVAARALCLPVVMIHVKEKPKNNAVNVVGKRDSRQQVVARGFREKPGAEQILKEINFVSADIRDTQRRMHVKETAG